jgi:hypothetical protein
MPIGAGQRGGHLAGEDMTLARLAISKGFLAEYLKLDKDLQRAVDQAIAAFARDPEPALHLEKPQHDHDDRFGLMPVNGHFRGVVLTPGDAPPEETSPEDTYSLVTVLPQDQVAAYVTDYLFSVSQALEILEAHPEAASTAEASTAGASPEKISAEEGRSELQTLPEAEPVPHAEPLLVPVSAPGQASPSVDAQLRPAVALLNEETASQAPPEAPTAASPEQAIAAGHFTRGPEPEQAQRRPFAAWRARRRSRRLARDGSLTQEHDYPTT